MLKAVIYDMDGLMVDSEPISFRATELVLEKYGHSINEIPKEMVSDALGRRVVDILGIFKDILNIKASVDELKEERNKVFMQEIKKDLKAMPGLEKSLKMFRKHNMKIALASSAFMDYIDFVLDRFNIRSYFDAIVSGDDVKKGKPDPETYAIACRLLNIEPRCCVVLEDAPNGIKAAKTAGCRCIAIKNQNMLPHDLSKADIALDSLEEINDEILGALMRA